LSAHFFRLARAFIDSGFDVIQGHPNGAVARKIARLAFEHMGDPFQPFIYGQTHLPIRVATQERIGLVFWGEDGELAYGGSVKQDRAIRAPDDHDRHYFSGKGPEYWESFGVTSRELEMFQGPINRIGQPNPVSHFLSYYKNWIPQENFYYVVEHLGFTPNPERTCGTYSKYASLDDELDSFHYYLSYLKFGIGRATSDSAHEIRDGHITRDEGVALVKKFDGEFPRNFSKCCEYMGIKEADAMAIFEKWKSPDIWDGDKLKCAVWM